MAGMTRCCTRPEPVDLLVDGLAVYRLTRLLTLDSLPPVKRAREKVRHRWGGSEWSELAVCPWCMSVWVAAGVVAARTVAPRAWSPLARVLAASAVTGWLSSRE
jgi:hypothetical protein